MSESQSLPVEIVEEGDPALDARADMQRCTATVHRAITLPLLSPLERIIDGMNEFFARNMPAHLE